MRCLDAMKDVVGSSLGRFGASFREAHLADGELRAHAGAQLAIDEVRALSLVDDVLAPEELDLPRGDAFFAPAAIDARRLPPPPVSAPDGQTLYRALSSYLNAPLAEIAAPAEALAKESAMRALLRGIHGLEVEIRERMSRGRRG